MRKLKLSRETLRALDTIDLGRADGGQNNLSRQGRCGGLPTSTNPPPAACKSELVSDCGGC